MGTRRALMALTILLFVAAPAPVGAERAQATQSSVTAAAESLRRNPVYVDPEAERALSDSEVAQLSARIADTGEAVFLAVLPASAAGQADADQVVRDLVRETGLSGTYGAVVGNSFRATSTLLANADEIASAAFQSKRDNGTLPVLDEFVQRVSSKGRASASGADASPGTSTGSRSGQRSSGGSSLLPVALLAVAAAALLIWSRRKRRQRDSVDHAQLEHELASDRQMLQAQLSVVSDDVIRLEPQITLHPEARTDYDAAVERYRIASAAMDYADEPVDMVRVQRVVEEASYAMSRARAIVEGRTPPAPPEDLRRPGARQEPALDLDDAGMPFYAGGAPFYGGGWFGGGGGYRGGGGLFGGLLLGSMLGGFSPFGMWGGGNHIEFNDYGNERWGGGGDGWGEGFGGGDWGGGGGDWGGGGGGGDLGGGDW